MRRALTVTLLAALLPAAALAQSPAWTAIVNVRPEPSPYIADWENDPLMVTLVLSYTGSATVVFHLEGSILRGSTPVVSGRSTTFEFVRPTQLILTAKDGIWERNSVTYEALLRDQIQRTGRIPDGEYQFCADVRQGPPESPGGALLARDCAPFSITAPQPPSLVSPQDGDSVRVPYPTFVWTPVVTGTSARFNYHVRIARIQPGQTPFDALANVPHYEADLTSNALSYPATALPLEDSASYVWQVQALDDAGQPLGERQGKSEAWRFGYQPGGPIVAAQDTAPAEPAVGRFRWAGLEVKVLSLTDSSRDNYSGVGRLKIIPGVFEPSFEFASVRLDSSGSAVRRAPRHVISLPDDMGVVDWVLQELPATPFFLNLRELVLVADSAGDQFVGVSGSASLFLGFGMVDSLQEAGPIDVGARWNCDNTETVSPEPLAPELTVCRPARDPHNLPDSTQRAQMMQVYEDMKARSLYFRFDTVGVGSSGPSGTLRLGREFSSGVFGLNGAHLTLAADSTVLTLGGGEGRLDLQGTFRFPSGVGLIKDQPDTVWTDTTKKEVESVDSTITLKFRRIRLGTDGEALIAAEGIPRARIGQTGIRIQSGDAWIDLSGSLSPPGRAPGWRGVFFDSLRVFLPDAWHFAGRDSASAQGDATILGRNLAVDGSGLDGEIIGSGLENLGPVGFGGFEGWVDSVRFAFSSGTLDVGYVEGRLIVPFLDGQVPYWAEFTPVGVERAFAKLTEQQRIPMPALGGEIMVQRGEFVYERPVGTFTVDAKISLTQAGVGLHEAQLYGLTISNDGGIKLRNGWIALDVGGTASFDNFPVDVDSIGFGSGTTGDEVWLGVAGRFAINDNLPSAAGAFRVFAVRDAPGSAWRFSRLAVDRLNISYQNAAVAFSGGLEYVRNDSIYGNAFKAAVRLAVVNQFSVDGTFIAGATTASQAARAFRYWYVDARLVLPPPGIQLGPLPLAIWGFAGGAYSRMAASIDSVTLKATYRPDSTNMFGLKAAVSIGTSANSGYIWNSDSWLEAAVGQNGGLQSLTLRGDHWMLTEVARREERLWGSVLINLPVSQPILHANATMNVNLPPALRGSGWAELHFEPNNWYVNVGTPSRPDSLTLLPASLNMPATAWFHLDREQVNTGLGVHLEQERRKGSFRGRVAAGFEAGAQMRYRPFQVTGDGELWGEIVAEVKAFDEWYEILSGTARATMHFRFPDPMGVWGRIKLKYRLLGGSVKGTYRMNYSWGNAPNEGESDSSQFVLVAATYPAAGDTAAGVTGMTYYLGMNEGTEYGMDDGTYRLRLTGTPLLQRRTVQDISTRDRNGRTTTRQMVVWQSLGTVERDWLDERATLVLKPPAYAMLSPATSYRAAATFELQKLVSGTWTPIQTVNSSVEFRTSGQAPILAQLVTESDPAGASPLYFGGSNAGAVRVRFSNVHPDLTSGAVTGRLVAAGNDTVAGVWGASTYAYGSMARASDPTLFAFRPAAGALLPNMGYRFAVVSNDTSAREHHSITFKTSRYATLLDHVNASTRTVTADRGPGASGTGNFLLRTRVVLAGNEPIAWDDIDSIDVVGLTSWTVTPRTRCQVTPGVPQLAPGLGIPLAVLCGATPVFENVLDVKFVSLSDAELPPSSTSAVTIRLNHRREGWRSFTFTLPTLAQQIAGAGTAAAAGVSPTGSTAPTTSGAAGNILTTVPTTTPPPTIDVTRIRP